MIAGYSTRMSEEDVERVRAAYEAWNRRDLDAAVEGMDRDIEWRFHGGTLFPGTDRSYHGPDGVRRFWEEFLEPWGTIRIEVEETRESSGRVVAFVRFHATGSSSGVELDVPFVHLITIRDGLATRFDAYADRAEALEAAGLAE
jgi:uncharacterized protein